jgi:hypothetical protein
MLWYVDSGLAIVELASEPAQRIQDGKTFCVPKGGSGTVSTGNKAAARLIAFRLLNSR